MYTGDNTLMYEGILGGRHVEEAVLYKEVIDLLTGSYHIERLWARTGCLVGAQQEWEGKGCVAFEETSFPRATSPRPHRHVLFNPTSNQWPRTKLNMEA